MPETSKKCPAKEVGTIQVSAKRTDKSLRKKRVDKPLSGVKFTLQETGESQTTGSSGAVIFKKLEPKSYTVKGEVTGDLASDFEVGETQIDASVTGGEKTKVTFPINRLATIEVQVSAPDGKKLKGVDVSLSGVGDKTVATDAEGLADFGKMPIGNYQIAVKFKKGDDNDKAFKAPQAPSRVTLARGDDRSETIAVEDFANAVTAKLVLEDAATAWVHATFDKSVAVPIEIFAAQTRSDVGYDKDGQLERASAELKLFTDDKCKSEVVWQGNVATLKNSDLLTDKKKYWVKSDKAGSVGLELKLPDPGVPYIRITNAQKTVDLKQGSVIAPVIALVEKGAAIAYVALPADKDAPPPEKDAPAEKPLVTVFNVALDEKKNDGKVYTGHGKLTRDNENLELFLDEDCKKPLTFSGNDAKLTNDQLRGGDQLKLYGRGKTKGKHKLVLTLDDADHESIAVTKTVDLEFEVKPMQRVRAVIDAEYKVTLAPPKDVVDNDADKVHADPTLLELWFKQTDGEGWDGGPYGGKGTLKVDNENLKLFTDEKCEKPLTFTDGAATLANDDLVEKKKLKLYARGVTAGKTVLTFELEDEKRADVARVAAKMEIGVVALQLKMHVNDKTEIEKLSADPDAAPPGGTSDDSWNAKVVSQYHEALEKLKLPDQKEMADADKVKIDAGAGRLGRVLHLQKDGNHGRARLIVKKLDEQQWPKGTDDYEFQIDKTAKTGELEIFDAAVDGKSVALPVKIKFADLKSKDQEYWVQGKALTDKPGEVRLDVALDRKEGGLAKKVKRHGDWARFTVVEIKEVKLDYTKEVGKAEAWDASKKRFYVNLKSDGSERKVTIGATLEKPIAGVNVHFALIADKDNYKTANWGIDLPKTWKRNALSPDLQHEDKADRKKLLHLTAKTDDKGYAKVELKLSRFGGDKFTPAAYIDQDPHLAKYVAGHAELEKKKPLLSKTTIEIWRKIWFKRVMVQGINCPEFDGAIGQYERVKVEMVKAPDLVLQKNTVKGYNPTAIYKKFMVLKGGDGSDALVVSDTNKTQFFTTFADEADKPNMIPILVCDAQWDAKGNTDPHDENDLKTTDFPRVVTFNKDVCSPPLQGGSLVAGGSWTAAEWDATANSNAGAWVNVRSNNFSDADVEIVQGRGGIKEARIKLPAGVGVTTATTSIDISGLTLQGAAHYLGESFQKKILAVFDPAEPADFQNTIAHEIGHAYAQVLRGDPAGGVAGVPRHPNQRDMGQGNHCRYETNKCVMYDSGPITGSHNRYCDVCHPYLIAQNMTTIK